MSGSLFESLSTKNLHSMYTTYTKVSAKETLPLDDEIAEELSKAVEMVGIRHITYKMKLADLTEICSDLDLKTENDSKSQLHKRLYQAVGRNGLGTIIEKMKKEHVLLFIEYLEVEPATSGKLVKQLEKEIRTAGLEVFLSKFGVETLQNICDDLKILADTSSPSALISAIIHGKLPPKKVVQRVVPKITKTKPVLKKGVTVDNILQHYYKEELDAFCRENHLAVSGRKRELAKRIVQFVNGETEKENDGKKSNKKEVEEESALPLNKIESKKKDTEKEKVEEKPVSSPKPEDAPVEKKLPGDSKTKTSSSKGTKAETNATEKKGPKMTAKKK